MCGVSALSEVLQMYSIIHCTVPYFKHEDSCIQSHFGFKTIVTLFFSATAVQTV